MTKNVFDHFALMIIINRPDVLSIYYINLASTVTSVSHYYFLLINFNPFYPEASADELQPVPDHFLK